MRINFENKLLKPTFCLYKIRQKLLTRAVTSSYKQFQAVSSSFSYYKSLNTVMKSSSTFIVVLLQDSCMPHATTCISLITPILSRRFRSKIRSKISQQDCWAKLNITKNEKLHRWASMNEIGETETLNSSFQITGLPRYWIGFSSTTIPVSSESARIWLNQSKAFYCEDFER